jgi:hypothetical protein
METKLTGDAALELIKRLATDPARAREKGPRQPATPSEAIAAGDRKPMLVAVFTVENGELRLCRYTTGFPNADMPRAAELLRQDLEREAPWEFHGKTADR